MVGPFGGPNKPRREVNEQPTILTDVLHSSSTSDEEAFKLPYGVTDGEDRIDPFGLPEYRPRYPLEQRYYESALSVPWNHRIPIVRKHWTFFDFFRSRQFWQQIEFALRITIFAVLIPSVLIAADLPGSPFISTTFTFSAAVLASKVTVGEGLAYLCIWIRAGCVWLPIATIGASIHLENSMAGWCVYYTAFLFIMATLTENMVRRVCLLLFNNCMIGILINPARGTIYPSRVMVDWCIGTGLCLLACFLPYPIFCKNEAQAALANIARNMGASFIGLTSCFWSESNVGRNMAATKVRMMTQCIDEQLHKYAVKQDFSFYEFIFEKYETREVRAAKAKLFERLRSNLRGLSRVIDILESKPWVVDDSERSKAFGDTMRPHIENFSSSLDKLTDALAEAKSFSRLKDLHPMFLDLNDSATNLQAQFSRARRKLFYEQKPETLEEFVPLMTFFIFSVINFRDTLMQFDFDVRSAQISWRTSAHHIVRTTVFEPMYENVIFFKKLLRNWRRREIQRVIEAAKVSAAMILTVGFSYLIEIDKASLSGPNIIAFVSGNNPVEAVQASVVRLTACILGTVLGFFAGSYSETKVDKVASLSTLMFFGTFLRNDKDYGIMAVYAMFVLIPLDTVGQTTTEDTLQRMNQITFGIFIYLFISMLIFPLSPSLILRKRRINILIKVSEALTQLANLFSEPLPIGNLHSPSILRRLNPNTNGGDEMSNMEPLSLSMQPSTGVLNLSTRLVVRTDVSMKNLDVLLTDIEHRLKATYPFMGFAREERGLVDADYPVKSCEKVSFHLYRMICLLRTMWCSWDVLRSQKFYSPDMRNVLHNLQPIAWDASRSFSRFVDMVCYLLRNPSTTLETDLIQIVLEFIQSADELHLRKNQIMVIVINSAVMNHVAEHHLGGDTMTGEDMNETAPRRNKRSNISRSKTGGSDSILPALRKGTKLNLLEDESTLPDAVSLSKSFVLPISGEDAEGLHSFTLSLQMFADESKLLLMSLEEMLEHQRSKL